MSENKRNFQTNAVNNGKLQSSVATHLRLVKCSVTVFFKFIAESESEKTF